MALNIQSNIELSSGVVLNSAYCRIDPSLDTSGKRVFTQVGYWVSENDYMEGKWPLEYSVPLNYRYDYDRTTDGSDILMFSNEKIKEELETKGFSVQIIEL